MPLESEWAEESSQGSKDTWARFPKLDWGHALPVFCQGGQGWAAAGLICRGKRRRSGCQWWEAQVPFPLRGKNITYSYHPALGFDLSVERRTILYFYIYTCIYIYLCPRSNCNADSLVPALPCGCGVGRAALPGCLCFVLSLSSSRWEPRVFSPNRKSGWRRGGAALQSAEVLYSSVT